jgi:hypothetical protein
VTLAVGIILSGKVQLRIAGLLFAGAIQLACSDRVTQTFANLDQARHQGMIARGWIPSWLPASANHITVSYDLDTNEVWLTFSLLPDAQLELRNDLVLAPLTGDRVRHPGIPWPRFLVGALDQREVEKEGYITFVSVDRQWFAAVHSAAGKYFLWRPPPSGAGFPVPD